MTKILIVEDEPDVREIIQFILESAGYQTLTAANGAEGLEIAREKQPSLIITDVLMPVMGGYELYKQLKKEKMTAVIPVLILTGRGQMEDSFKVLGADGFMAKPFDDYVLLTKVANLLKHKLVLNPPELPSSKKGKKVLVAGDYREVLDSMAAQLKQMDCIIETAASGPETISKCVTFAPDVLIMSAQVFGECPAEEIVKVIHVLPKFGKLPILLYSYYPLYELGERDGREQALSVDACQIKCMKAGASVYLGRFHEHSFGKMIGKYL